jgi:F420-dependent oxidoreductase-like protein
VSISGFGVDDVCSPEFATAAIDVFRSAGVDSLWAAEIYGLDCFTPLAWWGAQAQEFRLGTVVAQIAARQPTAMAMAALSLDRLTQGGFTLGLGVSGPQVVEGWYGLPFTRPLAWTREYIEIIRRAAARVAPVEHHGERYDLPARGGSGLGKPLRASLRPQRPDMPIYLGAEGPKNVALAAEVADGWLATNYSPIRDDYFRGCLEEGFARGRANGRDYAAAFEVVSSIRVAVDDDLEVALDRLRPDLAFYIGAMGARDMNFHLNAFARLGFAAECEEIQARFRAGDRDGACRSVPAELVEAVCLVGPPDKIVEDLRKGWHQSVVDTLVLRGPVADCAAVAKAVARSRS